METDYIKWFGSLLVLAGLIYSVVLRITSTKPKKVCTDEFNTLKSRVDKVEEKTSEHVVFIARMEPILKRMSEDIHEIKEKI